MDYCQVLGFQHEILEQLYFSGRKLLSGKCLKKTDVDHAHKLKQSTELWEAKSVIFSTLLTTLLNQQVAKSNKRVKEPLTVVNWKTPQDVWELTSVV